MSQEKNNLFNNETDALTRQLFMLGYCDGRLGLKREIKEVRDIVKKIVKRRQWDESQIDLGIFTLHYSLGFSYYYEIFDCYHAGLYKGENPENELLYHLFVETDGVEPIILELVQNYPDFKYEMMVYYQEKEKKKNSK